jgi:hypothetical protein
MWWAVRKGSGKKSKNKIWWVVYWREVIGIKRKKK